MKEDGGIYEAAVECVRLNGANTFTLMKHKLIRHTNALSHHDYYNVVL